MYVWNCSEVGWGMEMRCTQEFSYYMLIEIYQDWMNWNSDDWLNLTKPIQTVKDLLFYPKRRYALGDVIYYYKLFVLLYYNSYIFLVAGL